MGRIWLLVADTAAVLGVPMMLTHSAQLSGASGGSWSVHHGVPSGQVSGSMGVVVLPLPRKSQPAYPSSLVAGPG